MPLPLRTAFVLKGPIPLSESTLLNRTRSTSAAMLQGYRCSAMCKEAVAEPRYGWCTPKWAEYSYHSPNLGEGAFLPALLAGEIACIRLHFTRLLMQLPSSSILPLNCPRCHPFRNFLRQRKIYQNNRRRAHHEKRTDVAVVDRILADEAVDAERQRFELGGG